MTFDTNRDDMRKDEDKKSGQSDGQRGGSGNFANDPQRAADAGRKGGQANQAGRSSQGAERSDDE